MLNEGITAAHLSELYSDPYITKISYDNHLAQPIIHPLAVYLSAWVNGIFAGAFLVIKFSKFEFEVHSLLKKKFIKQSRELGKELIQWVFAHESVERLTVYIIEGLESAKNYCLKLGFKHEGTRRNACVKDGVLLDVHVLGMLRGEA